MWISRAGRRGTSDRANARLGPIRVYGLDQVGQTDQGMCADRIPELSIMRNDTARQSIGLIGIDEKVVT